MEKEPKIITVLPAVTGCGAKYCTVSIAYGIRAKDKNAKILILDFDFRNPTLLGDALACEKGRGLDTVVAQIDAGVMNDELFKDSVVNYNNLFDVLKGTEIPDDNSIIKAEHITKIFDLAKKDYNYIVCVVAPDDENAGTVYGLYHADEIVLTVRPNFAALNNLDFMIRRIIERYKNHPEPFKVIYNMRSATTYKYEEMASLLDKHSITIGEFAYNEDTIDNLNLDKTGFRSKKIGTYETSCLQIATELMNE